MFLGDPGSTEEVLRRKRVNRGSSIGLQSRTRDTKHKIATPNRKTRPTAESDDYRQKLMGQ